MPTSTTQAKTRESQFPELAELLRRRRYALGLTLKEAALAAGVAGWQLKWLEGDLYARLPPPEVIRGLAAALDLETEELLVAAGYLAGGGGDDAA